ncbi:hypothetical protein GCM10008018_65940 [Paenibacillus marchantiophytorum]|uniref:Mutator family transposase n=1 Tax=Paenibacillus marchantiophytorum TaxID=1619310 RepID=A0ABQ1FGB5_9BACL|nr:hypothetical protein GCM10008018_65940 [Paenibacillus marchantiophytorum]
MYKGGMSTREVAGFIESMFGAQYSPTTVSNITGTVLEDVEKWQKRPLEKRYSVIYLDGLYVKLKRSTVDSEVIYLLFVSLTIIRVLMRIQQAYFTSIYELFMTEAHTINGQRSISS